MGFFSKIASALKKTKDKFADTFARVFSIDRIGEEFYDELLDDKCEYVRNFKPY